MVIALAGNLCIVLYAALLLANRRIAHRLLWKEPVALEKPALRFCGLPENAEGKYRLGRGQAWCLLIFCGAVSVMLTVVIVISSLLH